MPALKMEKKKMISLAIIIVAFGATGVLLLRMFSQPDAPTVIPIVSVQRAPVSGSAGAAGAEETQVEELQRVVGDLEQFGNWPVTLGELGRINPFIPVK